MKASTRIGTTIELLAAITATKDSKEIRTSNDNTGGVVVIREYGYEPPILRILPLQARLGTDEETRTQEDSGWYEFEARVRDRILNPKVPKSKGTGNWKYLDHMVVIARGAEHFGSSVRGRCWVEVWHHSSAFNEEWNVLHLEHVDKGFSAVEEMADWDPRVLLKLQELGALREYKTPAPNLSQRSDGF